VTVPKLGSRNVDVQSETRSSSAASRAQGWRCYALMASADSGKLADSRAVLRTNADLTLRQEDVPPDAIMLIEFSSKLRHWMSPEDASPEEIIAYIHSMQTDPTCHT
jgi:hypothetical protein